MPERGPWACAARGSGRRRGSGTAVAGHELPQAFLLGGTSSGRTPPATRRTSRGGWSCMPPGNRGGTRRSSTSALAGRGGNHPVGVRTAHPDRAHGEHPDSGQTVEVEDVADENLQREVLPIPDRSCSRPGERDEG